MTRRFCRILIVISLWKRRLLYRRYFLQMTISLEYPVSATWKTKIDQDSKSLPSSLSPPSGGPSASDKEDLPLLIAIPSLLSIVNRLHQEYTPSWLKHRAHKQTLFKQCLTLYQQRTIDGLVPAQHQNNPTIAKTHPTTDTKRKEKQTRSSEHPQVR